MKGLVLSIGKNKSHFKRTEATYIFKRYGNLIFLISSIILGLIIGSIVAGNSHKGLSQSFDFLFVTNLSARLKNSFMENFSSSFVSNFIFFIVVCFMGFFPFAKGIIPFICFFKGFGTGVSASFLYITYGTKGLMFYLIVLLPGLFLFLLSLVLICEEAFVLSGMMFKKLFTQKGNSVDINYMDYIKHSLLLLVLTTISSLVDAVFWITVGGMFTF